MLMSRDTFRNAVFERDSHKCVICDFPAADAHHIMERRLFTDGGYYLDNGASLCPNCHIEAEKTIITVEHLLQKTNSHRILPPHLYDDEIYDKWGNCILPNGKRLRGELFNDDSVQKILRDSFHLFTHYVKYPRTYHLPWSDGMNDDDRMMASLESFQNQEIVMTEKMDGENTTMYNDHIHARSVNSGSHPSRTWVKNFWSQIRSEIPDGWRICGENLYAKHSIMYNDLKSFFLGFSVWSESNECLSWDDTIEWFSLLGIQIPNVLYRGAFLPQRILAKQDELDFDLVEGYVVRLTSSFPYKAFSRSVGKFVRRDHIQTNKHWMMGQQLERNNMQ